MTTATNTALLGSSVSLGQRFDEAMLHLVRAYTFNTPIPRGKYRLYGTALRLFGRRHDSLYTKVKDGREFCINLSTGMQDTVFFIGEYERAITSVVERLVRRGDVCIDVGANFGWYTTLLAKRVGVDGEVHSFEPVPDNFRELARNFELLGSPDNVFMNRAALGDHEGTVTLNLFNDLPTGHASISSQGRTGAATFECPMLQLDNYLEDRAIPAVDFVKVDIEGAEMMFLNGARSLFRQDRPPIFLMEMALEQTRNFGYLPDDLIKFIGSEADYRFFQVDELRGRLRQIDGFEKDNIGGNVFCIPDARSLEPVADLID